jgi:biotin operon repressor
VDHARPASALNNRGGERPVTRNLQSPREPCLGQHEIDELMRMNTSLLAEVWQLTDRLAVLEQLLQQKAIIGDSDVDRFVPGPELAASLERRRAAIIRRVLGSLDESGYTVESLRAAVPPPKQAR